ncbi:mitotic-spindle organizing gamma-tubulin ring associated-domain-containing protein [Phycomyces nitens]|nr:mitotic-spindle organizing gamma-tubulin ring associated-domain-containing protein [Phycomyces nitens]
MEQAKSSDVKETLSILTEMASLLNANLDCDTLAFCISMCEKGVNPEALAAVIKDLRKEEQLRGASIDTSMLSS